MCGRVIFTNSELFIINYIHIRKEAVKSIVYNFFKNLAKYWNNRYWSVIIKQLGISFFVYWGNFSYFENIRKLPKFNKFVKKSRQVPGNVVKTFFKTIIEISLALSFSRPLTISTSSLGEVGDKKMLWYTLSFRYDLVIVRGFNIQG